MPELSDNQIQEIAQMVAQIREQWASVIETLVEACNGNGDATREINLFFDEMGQKEDWRTLIDILRRILAGERDPEKLLANLDDTDMLVVSDMLRALGVDPHLLPALPGEEPADDDDGRVISLEEFLQMVTAACKPDASVELKEQMNGATQGMTTQNNPPEIRELGRVLGQILAGNRNPDLLVLHPQLIGRVRQMLEEIKG